MQGKFVDRADVHEHIMSHVQKLRNGRSYMTRRVDAKQGDTVLFSVSMSFQLREPNEPTYFVPSPKVVNLDDFQSLSKDLYDPYVSLRQVVHPEQCMHAHMRYHNILHSMREDHPMYELLSQWTHDHTHVFPMQSRPAIPTMFDRDGHMAPFSKTAYWLSSRGYCRGPQSLQQAMLGFHVDQFFLVNMNTDIPSYTTTMMASLDHTMWFYNDFQMCDWLLFVLDNQALNNGRALITGRIYRLDGVLVAVVVRFFALTLLGARGRAPFQAQPVAFIDMLRVENRTPPWDLMISVLDYVPSYPEFCVRCVSS